MGGGQGGMTTQVNFHRRGEPTDMIFIPLLSIKSGFRQVIFGLIAAAITYGIGSLIGVSLAG